MLKSLVNLIKWLLILILIILAIFIGINWADEELKPEVIAALNWQPPADVYNDNGYIILLGIDAPIDQDAYQVGKAKYESEIARYKLIQSTHQEIPDNLDNQAQTFADWKAMRCDYRTSESCVDFYLAKNKSQLTEVIAEHQVQLDRFDDIRQSKFYIDASIPSTSSAIPRYSSLTSASELKRIQAVLALADNQTQKGMMILIENAQFSRRLLKSANSLISHMVALSMMQRDVQILSELLTRYPSLAETYQHELEPILATIETNEFSMQKSLEQERNTMLTTINNLKYVNPDAFFGASDINNTNNGTASFSQKMLFKTYQGNATSNLFYNLGSLPVKLAQSPPQLLDQAQLEYEQSRASYFKDCLAEKMLCIKNPVGKILAGISGPDILNYLQRHHDTEGYVRLVRLQKYLLAEKIPKTQIAQAASTYLNPYTQQAMAYDGEKNTLIFEGKLATKKAILNPS